MDGEGESAQKIYAPIKEADARDGVMFGTFFSDWLIAEHEYIAQAPYRRLEREWRYQYGSLAALKDRMDQDRE